MMQQWTRPIAGVRWIDRNAVVDVVGEVDMANSMDFQQGLLAVLDERPGRMIVNLSRVRHMDSTGLASLVKLLKKARKYGTDLILVGLTDRVRSLFEITRLYPVFTIFATEQEAMT